MPNSGKKQKHILLVGNPNVGKSTIFNLLCNKNQKTGNYAGVTVASHEGTYIYKDEEVEIVDLPGSYSIYPTSEDEAIFTKYLIEEQEKYSGVLYIADALNLKRSLLLYEQIKDLGIPILAVINQVDLLIATGMRRRSSGRDRGSVRQVISRFESGSASEEARGVVDDLLRQRTGRRMGWFDRSLARVVAVDSRGESRDGGPTPAVGRREAGLAGLSGFHTHRLPSWMDRTDRGI